MMYGKIFEDIFDGSLIVEGGPVAVYVFISMIVLADQDGIVRYSPEALGKRVGIDSGSGDFLNWKNFTEALTLLEKEDVHSNLITENGRRIIPLSEITEGQENRGWFIVNYTHYRDKLNKLEQQEKTNERVRRFRERQKKQTEQGCNEHETPCNDEKRKKRHTDTDTDTDKERNTKERKMGLFNKFWEEWPKKLDKEKAIKAFKKLNPDEALLEKMIKAIQRSKKTEDWLKENGKFIPYPTTWLNGRRWEDEISIKALDPINSQTKPKTLEEVKREQGLDEYTPEQLRAGKAKLSKVAMDVMKKKDINKIIGDKK